MTEQILTILPRNEKLYLKIGLMKCHTITLTGNSIATNKPFPAKAPKVNTHVPMQKSAFSAEPKYYNPLY